MLCDQITTNLLTLDDMLTDVISESAEEIRILKAKSRVLKISYNRDVLFSRFTLLKIIRIASINTTKHIMYVRINKLLFLV